MKTSSSIVAVLCLISACTSTTGTEGSSLTPAEESANSSAAYGNVNSASPANSVVLNNRTPLVVGDLESALAVSLDNSQIGSIIKIASGPYEGIEFKIVEQKTDYDTMMLTVPSGTNIEVNHVSAQNLDKVMKALVNTAGASDGTPASSRTETINGKSVFFYTDQTRAVGTSSTTESGANIDNKVTAVFGAATVGSDVQYYQSNYRKGPAFNAPSGQYTYEGRTVMFVTTDSYTSNTAQLVLDFGTQTGTFSASGFSPDQNVTTPRTISVNGNVQIDNTIGAFTSDAATLNVNGQTGTTDIKGILSSDADAAAGYMISSTPVDGVIGGLFVLPKSP